MARRRIGLRALASAAAALAAGAAQAQTPPQPAARPSAAAAKPHTVEGLTVIGSTPDVQSTIDRRSYTLGKDLQATTGSIADALRNVPSVDVDLQGNLSVRGDANVTILVDGKPSPAFEGAGRAEALQQLPADQIERVEVITNPSAALNPEGSGGVINLITKKSRGKGVTGSAYVTGGSAGLKRAGASFGYNSKTLQVTGSIAGNYQRNKQQGHEVRAGLGPVGIHDFVGRNITRGPSGRLSVGYALDPKDQLSASLSYNELLVYGHPADHFLDQDAGGATTRLIDRQGHRRFEEIDTGLTAGWKHTFGQGHELSLDLVANDSRPRDKFVYATLRAQPPVALPIEGSRDDATLKHSEVRLAYSREMPGGATLKAGFEWKHDDDDFNHLDGFGATGTSVVPDPARSNHLLYEQTINAAYATYERSFGDLGVQTGLRIEDTRWDLDQRVTGQRASSAYTHWYPTLHLSWKLDDESKLTASYSKRVQRPFPFLLNPLVAILDPTNLQQGNPGLQPAETQSYELGYERRRGPTLLTANLYYRDRTGDFSAVLRDLGSGVFLTTFDNVGSSRAAGLELTANGKLVPKLTYNAQVTLAWNEIDASNLALGVSPQSQFGPGGRINLNWQASADDLVQLNATARNAFVTAQGHFEPVYTVNLGWRRKVTDRVTATLTVQDLFNTNGFHRILRTPTLRDDLRVEPVSRAWLIRLDYRFGGGNGRPQREPGFEYETGGAGSPTP